MSACHIEEILCDHINKAEEKMTEKYIFLITVAACLTFTLLNYKNNVKLL